MSLTDTDTDTDTDPLDGDRVARCADRVMGAVLGAQQTLAIHLGDRLGWYSSLHADGPATAPELAARTHTDARYAREWLEHQAVCGFVDVEDPTAPPDRRRFRLPPEHAAVLCDPEDAAYLSPVARITVAAARRVDDLLEAYRTGGGVSWEHLGVDARDGQGDQNRHLLLHAFAPDYLAAIPDVDAALRRGGRVADVGCGVGWAAIGVARGYPAAVVEGVDVDPASVISARRHAEDHGVADRVRVRCADMADSPLPGVYDLVCAVECVHDMPDPVGVLTAMRRAVTPGGCVLVVDERVAEAFAPDGDELEQLFYGFSLTCCLPDGLSTPGSVGTGTVMRPSILERYALDAGFARVEVLDLDNDVFRFYRLHPPDGDGPD